MIAKTMKTERDLDFLSELGSKELEILAAGLRDWIGEERK